nr:hypothetical protein [Mycolicibacterium houstonense]
MAEQRCAQLMQAREGQFHVRLDPGHLGHLESGRLPDGIAEQRRLADAGFATYHQYRTAARAGTRNEPPEGRTFADAAPQVWACARNHISTTASDFCRNPTKDAGVRPRR